MSTVDEESMETWVEDLKAENERLKAEVASLVYDRDAYASVVLAGLSGLVGTPEKGYVKDGGYGLLKGDLHRLREKYRDAVASRDSCVGSYKACRNAMVAAGIPCNFGREGEPTTDEGMGRDLADCVKSLVERMQTAEAELAALTAENQSLREQGRCVEAEFTQFKEALALRTASFCTHCHTFFPAGAEGLEQFRLHIPECDKHPLAVITRKNQALTSLARRCLNRAKAAEAERDKLKAERSTLRSSLGSIHAIATDLCRAHGWQETPAEQIRDKAGEALDEQ